MSSNPDLLLQHNSHKFGLLVLRYAVKLQNFKQRILYKHDVARKAMHVQSCSATASSDSIHTFAIGTYYGNLLTLIEGEGVITSKTAVIQPFAHRQLLRH